MNKKERIEEIKEILISKIERFEYEIEELNREISELIRGKEEAEAELKEWLEEDDDE
jgi:hypothetical protein